VERPLRYLDDPVVLEQERQAFITAALEILAAADAVDLQVSRVVQKAARHNVVFYRIFGSKDGLILAVVEEATRRTAEVVEARMAEAATPAAAVCAWTHTLLSMARGEIARGALALALDRHRLLHRFPDARATLAMPLRQPLLKVLEAAGCPDVDIVADAAYELVMSRQASWIASGHEPSDAELDYYNELVLRLCGSAQLSDR
jgi:AcrR family transcriptional regulator